ncbi:hypothetical protein CHU92_07585 [Flavobacterium cyanobacteriorum]|uniref:Uncharacterized protein n=1 Tax=Flavobacterium cyanobacteriorum TaxID=2022802 RepID=A0A255Z8L0_9FLAO|nr:hypothetical protein [Flavobacterium cyanobacteriorum]OYQ37751.1 hypothetical protein CHU92_07585 [Flavobacterium cyanobacteriorum]
MKFMYKTLVAALLLVACSSANKDVLPADFTPSPQRGIAVGTLTFEGDKPMNDIYRLFYNAVKGDKKFRKRNAGKIMIKAREGNGRAFTGDFNNRKTYLFVIEREPGQYAFTEYNYLNHIGPNGMVNFSREFAIPFDIKAGTISYIGEITYNDAALPGTPKLVVTDKMDRDVAEFGKKYPAVPWGMAVNNTAKSGDTAGGLVEFR